MSVGGVNPGPSFLGTREMMTKKGNHVVAFKGVDNKYRMLSSLMQASMPEGSRRVIAIAKLILAPIWIPVRAAVSVLGSIANILTLGQLSVNERMVDNSLKGRAKAMGCSLLSIVTTPLNVAVEGVATIANVVQPTLHKVDLLASQMWTGFVTAKFSEQPDAPVAEEKKAEKSVGGSEVEHKPIERSLLDLQLAAKELAGRDPVTEKNLLFPSKLGYFRNSAPVIRNLFSALREFSVNGDLSAKIDASRASGQGSSAQPDTVGETFRECLDPEVHGGVLQTIDAIKKEANSADQPIAVLLQEVVDFVRLIPSQKIIASKAQELK
jgi:hypothetical protein